MGFRLFKAHHAQGTMDDHSFILLRSEVKDKTSGKKEQVKTGSILCSLWGEHRISIRGKEMDNNKPRRRSGEYDFRFGG